MRTIFWCTAALFVCHAPRADAYGVLAHEAIIDSAWTDSIQPLLVARFPSATPDDLLKAHAYAYGGCIIQDMGYYPFGSKFFSDLVHYVRGNAFITELVRSAQDLNEYAFALGALAHYSADTEGHPLAVNRAVPLLYPKARERYGAAVTYEQDPAAHMRTEFGFDVIQVAKGNYGPKQYHDFIGFEVSKPVLERAFRQTYGLELSNVFTSLDLALGTYRRAVGTVIPEITRTAWVLKEKDIAAARPGVTRRKFIYNISRASYEREWGREYHRPGTGARVLALVMRVMPKIGLFKPLAFKAPTPEAEQMFMLSFNRTLDSYRRSLAEVRDGALSLPQLDFDTGQRTHPGEYGLADRAYSGLVRRLEANGFKDVTADLKANILGFYADLDAPVETRRDPKKWRLTLAAIDKLKAQPIS